MFRNTFQSGFLSILYSIGSKPLQIWDATVQNGHVKRITDPDIQSSVVEIMGTNVSTNYIVCPADSKKTLGIKLPFLVMILKNMNKYFTFEVQVLDDKNVRRRFRASNYQSTTRVKPFICTMPMRLDEGWNQIQFNLSDFTRRAYGTNYIETLRVQIHANCRIRRIYFSDRLYTEDELPAEFRLLMPIAKKNRQLAAHAERDAVRKQAATETANNKASLCDRSGDGIRGGGGGGGGGGSDGNNAVHKATATTSSAAAAAAAAGGAKIEEEGSSTEGEQKEGVKGQTDEVTSAEGAVKDDDTSPTVSSASPTDVDQPAVAS